MKTVTPDEELPRQYAKLWCERCKSKTDNRIERTPSKLERVCLQCGHLVTHTAG